MNKQDEEKAKVRELARKHQGTMTDAQYLQMTYALEEMAAWKDEQFKEHGYTKKELYEMGFGFTLNGDIATPKEEREMQVQYFKYKKQQMIEKAVEFLKNYRQDTTDGFGYIPGIVNDQTIEDFKNYMEEN